MAQIDNPFLKHMKSNPKTRKHLKAFKHFTFSLFWLIPETIEVFLKKRDPLIPPRHLLRDGSVYNREIFKASGQDLLQLLIEVGGLKPNDRVLDVGCGVGRLARVLTQYLSPEGTYHGFDIVPAQINYCQRVYGNRFKNFHFRHADIANNCYNPKGKFNPHQYQFPFPDCSFSFVFLTSVFTHMKKDAVENYLSEIYRVLAPNGRCFITYFLLNQESEELIQADRSTFNFIYPVEQGKSTNEMNPEIAVAFYETYIRSIYQKQGFVINKPIYYGTWCGRDNLKSYQDIICAIK